MSFSRAVATAAWLIAVALQAPTAVDAAADESAAAHRAMSRLYRVAAGTWTTPTFELTAESTRLLINAANMSVAPQTWQDLFSDDDKTNAYDTLKDDAKELADRLGGKAAWDTWRLDKKNINTLKIGTDDSENYKKIREKAQTAECSRQIQVLVSQAQTLADKAKPLADFLTDDSKNKINADLNAALYGGDGTLDKPEAGKTTGTSGSYGTACTNSGNRLSIIGDFYCLCGGSGASQGECSKEYAASTVNADASAIAADWDNLRQSCGKHAPNPASPEAIHADLSSWEATLTQKTAAGPTTKVYMGTSADAKGDDCDGSGTKTCVSYTKYFVKNNGVDITEIPWYEALTTAATAIDSAKHNTHELRATLAQLAAVEAAVRITYNAAAAGRLAITAPQQTVHQHQAKQQATEIVEECHKHHGNNTICPKDKCTYGEKEKKCNPKVLEEATTGTGEGAAGTAAATGCAKHGTKAECDADKKDDKQNCAWRKGKEGETDEPEKEKCRSSSFLLNKQLALSMVAEFVFFL